MPWVFHLTRPSPRLLGWINKAGIKVLKILEDNRRFSQDLDGLRRLWQAETVIHGDLRFRQYPCPHALPETGALGTRFTSASGSG